MNEFFMDTLAMLMDGINFSLPITLGLWGLITTFQLCFDKRTRPSLMLFAAIGYVMLLLYGTCFSRISSLREFVIWRRADFSDFFTNDFSLTNPAMIWHEFMNVLLFVPWGVFTMKYSGRARSLALTIASGLLMTCLVESFQGFHGLAFDIGDVFTNTLGTAAGAYMYYPLAYAHDAIHSRIRHARRLPKRA